MMNKTTLHWFRKGLRLHDNAPLCEAISTSSTLIPLYILNTDLLDPSKVGTNRLGFLLESLKCLDEELREKGSRLFVAKGKPIEVLESFVVEFQVEVITFEKDTEPYNKELDNQVFELGNLYDINIHAYWGHTLYDPNYLLSLNDGETPLTMTSFLKIIGLAGPPLQPLEAPYHLPSPPLLLRSKHIYIYRNIPTLHDLKEYGYDSIEKTTWFKGGEKEGIQRLENFLGQKKSVASYVKSKTNPTSLIPDSTTLSPYLSLGVVSIRLFHSKLLECLNGSSTKIDKPQVSLEGQLYWRELAYLIGYSVPNFQQMLDNPICAQIPWLEDEKAEYLCKQWESGHTGYPTVDACMNQLRTDGWMHHLARQLVACFLTRGDLWITWEMGKDVFEKHLVDADWSINNFSWHWLSCSAFFHQYSCCYDPKTFFKMVDPSGEYVRLHVPVLKDFPDQYIYEPWLAPDDVQKASGCIIGQDYPKPLIDHDVASKDNIEKMREVFDNNKIRTLRREFKGN